MSKKRLIIIGLLVFGSVAIVVVSLLSKSSSGSACMDLLLAIEKSDTEGSYAMLSPTAQSSISAKAWDKSIDSAADFFNNVRPTLKSTKQIQDPQTALFQTREIYTIKTETGTYTATCYISQEGLIDVFSSEPGEPAS